MTYRGFLPYANFINTISEDNIFNNVTNMLLSKSLKYQKLFKTLIRSKFQGMCWCAHKTATLTSIQHTVPWCC